MVCVRRFEKFNQLCLLSVIFSLLTGLYREPSHAYHVPGDG
jgi:hypothetical protein